jgi:hypothetical protein
MNSTFSYGMLNDEVPSARPHPSLGGSGGGPWSLVYSILSEDYVPKVVAHAGESVSKVLVTQIWV